MTEVSETTHLLGKDAKELRDVESGATKRAWYNMEVARDDRHVNNKTDRAYRNFLPKRPTPVWTFLKSAFTPTVARPAQRDMAVKAVPPFAPYCRMARHRSAKLRWLNEFRHWWKSSRLLVRLGGLYTYANEESNWEKITTLNMIKKKGISKGLKLVKRLGQGGEMRFFLDDVKHFTRGVRIVVAVWRWLDAAPCRRREVGVEEFMAFIGNRVFRIMARKFVDFLAGFVVFPLVIVLIERGFWGATEWHSEIILLFLGILRSVLPFIMSFYGSRFGRMLTARAFHAARDRWLPTMRVNDVNLLSDDCQEADEVSPNADLVTLAKRVAVALSKDAEHCDDPSQLSDRHLLECGFTKTGSGSGGYAMYYYRSERLAARVHVTPYGPSILDELPRYVVLEHDEEPDGRNTWMDLMSVVAFSGPSVVEGYCYKGAFFSPYQFAAMKERYDEELVSYERACKEMCSAKASVFASPPTDLKSLKEFVHFGRTPRKQKKDQRRLDELQNTVAKLGARIKSKIQQANCVAPSGVIVYLEGLDCAGKSSTSGLVLAALEQAGYSVSIRRYNRPPTAEQKLQPWMNRFERPDTLVHEGDGTETCEGHHHSALVWDRGPAGDFVYGTLAKASEADKQLKYAEFMHFDGQCRSNNVMFFKLLFVTDRDSIARTLGKRLAHRKICKDLRKWLDASCDGQVSRPGLDEIDAHIDPSDFVAFNSYHDNLNKFITFAKNTNTSEEFPWFNPWLVVSTTHRHPARRQLLHRFQRHFEYFIRHFETPTLLVRLYWFLRDEKRREYKLRSLKRNAYFVRAVFLFMGILFLMYIYYINTDSFFDSD